MTLDPFTVMNVVGLLAFALVGSLEAIEADLDPLGVVTLGVVTALGGGTTRDLLVNQVPNALQSSTDVAVALVGVLVALLGTRYVDRLRNHALLLGADAVGLAAFATTGALTGHAAGLSPFGVTALATVTGVGGGAMADLLRGDVPFVLEEDVYATCAIVGSGCFVLALAANLGVRTAALSCGATTLAVRLLAIRGQWQLPTMSRVVAP